MGNVIQFTDLESEKRFRLAYPIPPSLKEQRGRIFKKTNVVSGMPGMNARYDGPGVVGQESGAILCGWRIAVPAEAMVRLL